MQQKRVEATNDNSEPQVGDYVHVRNRELARYISAHLGRPVRVAQIREDVVVLVAAADYHPDMSIPRAVSEVLSSGLQSFGLPKSDVMLVGPHMAQFLNDIYQPPGIVWRNEAD